MGMYTEFTIGCKLKEDAPKWVTDTLASMVEGSDIPKPTESDHPFFLTDRWTWMLMSRGSYYFSAKPCRRWEYDDIDNSWHLTCWTNIKNYSSEIEHFFDWIHPFLDTDMIENIGTMRYEESDTPTLVYSVNGNLKFISPIINFEQP